MRPQLVIAAAAAALATLAPVTLRAQPSAESTSPRPGLPAPSRAFELTVASGYTQPFGVLRPGLGAPQVANAGIGIDSTVGYRIDPHYAVSLGAQYQELSAERDDGVRGFGWGLALQYHVDPHKRVDPWVELGSGYKMFWLVPFAPGPTTLLHGPQLIRVRAGLDLRLAPDLAISPVIGADATMFVLQDEATSSAIPNPRLSTFVFAGLQTRIDAGGSVARSQ